MTSIAQKRVAGATALMILLYLLQIALFAPVAGAHTGETHACDTNYTEFTFVFVNGHVVDGDNCPESVYSAGKDIEAFFPGTGGAADYPNGPGMQVHVSCSDQFTDGWSSKGGPDIDDDPNWKIASYTIQKHPSGESSPDPCGQVFVTTTTAETTTTTADTTTAGDSESDEDSDSDEDGVGVLGTTITTTVAEVSADTLPFTGSESRDMVRLAMLALGAGALMLSAVRGSKKEEVTSTDIGGWSSL
ncbi:MAG: hypothetical protein WD532_06330 [Acidimicrobiia bacterium]